MAPLAWRRCTCRNHPDVGSMPSVCHDQEAAKKVGSDRNEAFLCMTVIRNGDRNGILEYADGVCEVYAVLC
jgi:hypothetical protein